MMNLHSNLIAFKTICHGEIIRFTRIWIQTILPPVITMSLYFIIFGQLIGPRIGTMDGFKYMQYIAPGLIMLSVITNSYLNVVSSFYGSRFQRNIEELLVSPTPNILILLGYVTGGIFRGLLVGAVVTAIALFFTDLTLAHPGITLLTVFSSSLLFSLAGFTNALFARKFDDITIIPTFVLTPLTYLGGVFYSISLLPEIWQKISLLNPILYMVNTFRYGILGITDINISLAFAIIFAFIIGLFVINLSLLNKGVGIRK